MSPSFLAGICGKRLDEASDQSLKALPIKASSERPRSIPEATSDQGFIGAPSINIRSSFRSRLDRERLRSIKEGTWYQGFIGSAFDQSLEALEGFKASSGAPSMNIPRKALPIRASSGVDEGP